MTVKPFFTGSHRPSMLHNRVTSFVARRQKGTQVVAVELDGSGSRSGGENARRGGCQRVQRAGLTTGGAAAVGKGGRSGEEDAGRGTPGHAPVDVQSCQQVQQGGPTAGGGKGWLLLFLHRLHAYRGGWAPATTVFDSFLHGRVEIIATRKGSCLPQLSQTSERLKHQNVLPLVFQRLLLSDQLPLRSDQPRYRWWQSGIQLQTHDVFSLLSSTDHTKDLLALP
jgi:hypothetical protein